MTAMWVAGQEQDVFQKVIVTTFKAVRFAFVVKPHSQDSGDALCTLYTLFKTANLVFSSFIRCWAANPGLL